MGGQILFRQSVDEILLDVVGSAINEAFMMNFSPSLLFIATWDRVPGFGLPPNVRMYYYRPKLSKNQVTRMCSKNRNGASTAPLSVLLNFLASWFTLAGSYSNPRSVLVGSHKSHPLATALLILTALLD